MKRRRIDPRRAKTLGIYDVVELAKLFGVCRGTIRDWIRRGMCPIQDGRRPALFLGDEVRRFLVAEQKARKRPTPPGHIFCFGCREHHIPAGNEADYRPRSATVGSLEGICPDCGRMLYRGVSLAKLERVRGNLHVKFLGGQPEHKYPPLPLPNPSADGRGSSAE